MVDAKLIVEEWRQSPPGMRTGKKLLCFCQLPSPLKGPCANGLNVWANKSTWCNHRQDCGYSSSHSCHMSHKLSFSISKKSKRQQSPGMVNRQLWVLSDTNAECTFAHRTSHTPCVRKDVTQVLAESRQCYAPLMLGEQDGTSNLRVLGSMAYQRVSAWHSMTVTSKFGLDKSTWL